MGKETTRRLRSTIPPEKNGNKGKNDDVNKDAPSRASFGFSTREKKSVVGNLPGRPTKQSRRQTRTQLTDVLSPTEHGPEPEPEQSTTSNESTTPNIVPSPARPTHPPRPMLHSSTNVPNPSALALPHPTEEGAAEHGVTTQPRPGETNNAADLVRDLASQTNVFNTPGNQFIPDNAVAPATPEGMVYSYTSLDLAALAAQSSPNVWYTPSQSSLIRRPTAPPASRTSSAEVESRKEYGLRCRRVSAC